MCFAYASSLILHGHICSAPSPCYCLNDFVDCSSKQLTQLPTFSGNSRLSKNGVLYVNLASNRLSTISDNRFSSLRLTGARTINIYLYNNQINNITSNAFAGIENLVHELDLENNKLTILPSAIGKLNHLKVLYIQGNPLRTLAAGVLQKIGTSLTDLRFSADYLNHWSSSNLHLLNVLSKLQVDKIPFKTLANDSFKGIENTLKTLVIYDSNLESVPGAICPLSALQSITFSRNTHLQTVIHGGPSSPCARPMSNVQTARFINNNFTHLNPANMFNVFPNASAMTVSGNTGLYYIPTTTLNKTTLVHLTDLNLDRNHFASVPHFIEKLHNLTTLSLKSNVIRVIDGDVFDNLHQLKTLQLNNNPLMYIESTAFTGLTSLTTLDLTGTDFQAIPEAVMKLPSLTSLSLDNMALNCTCELTHHMLWPSIFPFPLSASKVTVSGQCSSGSITVQAYIRNYFLHCKWIVET